jgi:hypothetical protein
MPMFGNKEEAEGDAPVEEPGAADESGGAKKGN